MTAEACMKDIGAGKVENLYLFYGKEEYLKDRTLEKLRDTVVNPAMQGLDDQFWDTERPVDEICAALDTPAFLSDRRLVVIRDDPRLYEKNADAKDFEKIAAHLCDANCLVFLCRNTPETGSAWVKAIKKRDAMVQFSALNAQKARPWITRMAKQAGGNISPDAAMYLFEYVGADLTQVQTEMEKLCALCRGEPITRRQIDAVCIPSFEFRVFNMLDALLTGQSERAMDLYLQSVRESQSAAMILSLLAGQLRVARYAVSAAQAGIHPDALAASLETKPFVAEKAMRTWRNAPAELLLTLQEACAQADREFKQGIRSDQQALEQVIFSIQLMRGKK